MLRLPFRVMDYHAINALYKYQNEPYVALPAMSIGGDQWEFWVEFDDCEITVCVLLQQLVLQTFEEKLRRKWGIYIG